MSVEYLFLEAWSYDRAASKLNRNDFNAMHSNCITRTSKIYMKSGLVSGTLTFFSLIESLDERIVILMNWLFNIAIDGIEMLVLCMQLQLKAQSQSATVVLHLITQFLISFAG